MTTLFSFTHTVIPSPTLASVSASDWIVMEPQDVVTMMRPDRIWEITPLTFVVLTWSSAFTWVTVTARRQAAAKNHRTIAVRKNVVIGGSFFRMMSSHPAIRDWHCRRPVLKRVILIGSTPPAL